MVLQGFESRALAKSGYNDIDCCNFYEITFRVSAFDISGYDFFNSGEGPRPPTDVIPSNSQILYPYRTREIYST